MEILKESLKHLFHQEFSKMVAVISKQFGLQHIETAEDIVSETFLKATESWTGKGIPANPTAWLYAVARQKMLYQFRRNKILTKKIIPELRTSQETFIETEEVDFSSENIKDSQLKMMFAICSPAIASEAQIGLALRILCGFGIDEIAEAFLSNNETINKRLFRAKEKLRAEKITLEMPGEGQIIERLDNVLHIIYLLFNEGYYSQTNNQIIRQELSMEALRLGILLSENEKTNRPKTNALIALMCFHCSRFNARQINEDAFILYDQQDVALWDQEMISQGLHFMDLSLAGNEISSYHLEAMIACRHCTKEDTTGKWEDILQLYNQLLMINYSPSAALNRTYALYKVAGREKAILEAEKLKLESNHFYFLLLGELYRKLDDQKAKRHFQKAHALAKTQKEQTFIQKKIDLLA